MQKNAVVYFPNNNVDAINSFRKRYDPNFSIIPPHITIISPHIDIPKQQLIEHVADIAKSVKPFQIHVKGIRKTSDNYLFLVIQEGNKNIVTLHEKLYSGILAPYTPEDYPFMPHITLGILGNTTMLLEAEKANFDITCSFDALSIIKGDGISPAEIVKTVPLI